MSETVMETATNPTDAASPTTEAAVVTTTVETPVAEQKSTEVPNLLGEDKPAEAEAKVETKPEVPEKYEFKAPEGKEFDPKLIDSFSDAAKEAGLTQDAAQKLIEKMSPALEARQQDFINATRQQWYDASIADKEFGGDKLKENLGIAKKAMDSLATPELRTLLEVTGLANNPEMIRVFYRAGKAISEDSFVSGSGSSAKPQDATAVLYPTMKKE